MPGIFRPLYISGGNVRRLETGGMVVGLFNDVPFQQGAVEIEHGGMLVAYSDGLIEPENVYGEEFGTDAPHRRGHCAIKMLLPTRLPRP